MDSSITARRIPFGRLPDDVNALFIKDFARCKTDLGLFEKDQKYKVELSTRLQFIYTTDGTKEVKNSYIKAFYTYTDSVSLSLEEFANHFDVPNTPFMDQVYEELMLKYRDFVDLIYKTYKLHDYEFQKVACVKLLIKDCAILSDEQGLGKTIISLVWMRVKRLLDTTVTHSLIIAPQDLILQWQEEGLKVGMKLRRLDEDNPDADAPGCYVTYYEFIRDYYEIYKDRFQIIIPDEAHKIKSREALRGKAIRSLNAKYKLPLSGTPIKNIVEDLHFLLGWLYGFESDIYPYAENEQYKFRKDFGVYEIVGGHRKLIPSISNLQELQFMLSPVVLRRTFDDIDFPMPKFNLYGIEIDFTPEQKAEYDKINNSQIEAVTKNWDLRRVCAYYPGSRKISLIKKLVRDCLNKGEQIVIFTGLVDMGEFLLNLFGDDARLANGNVSPSDREVIISNFKKGLFPILIAGIEAVNAGHSLQNASTCIVTDFVWTSSSLDQAMRRIYRIVSTKDVCVYLLYIKDSVDEEMLNVVNLKRESAEQVLDGKPRFEYSKIEHWRIAA